MPVSRDLLSAGVWALLAGIWVLIGLFWLGVSFAGSAGGMLIIALCAPGFALIIVGERLPSNPGPALFAALLITAAALAYLFATNPKQSEGLADGTYRCADGSFGRFCE